MGPAILTLRELNLLRIYLPVLVIATIARGYYKELVGLTLLFIFIINIEALFFPQTISDFTQNVENAMVSASGFPIIVPVVVERADRFYCFR